VASRLSVTRCARRGTPRCWEIAGLVTSSNLEAMWDAGISTAQIHRSISRRLGSASALRAVSTEPSVSIHLRKCQLT
jgi:hypothetical protein